MPPKVFITLVKETQLEVKVKKREHYKRQTKELTVLEPQVRKEVVITGTQSLSCMKGGGGGVT